jgi:hypothetical protein
MTVSAPEQVDYFLPLLTNLQGKSPPETWQHLVRAADEHPADPRPLLVLAGAFMQAQMVDRAEAAYLMCLERAPDLAIARFQLGLLQLTSARPAAASVTWAPLERLGAEHPLRLFKQGLEAVAQDRFDEARRLLLEGIARNTENIPLNRDMQMVLERIEKLPAAPGASGPEKPAEPEGHFLVSTYQTKP